MRKAGEAGPRKRGEAKEQVEFKSMKRCVDQKGVDERETACKRGLQGAIPLERFLNSSARSLLRPLDDLKNKTPTPR